MTALPAATAYTDSAVTQGQFKTAMTDLRDYLNGLLGSDGLPATARTALAVPPIASATMTTQLNVAAANSATVKIYSDSASEAVIETTNASTPSTKYRTSINKFGGETRLGGSTGVSLLDTGDGMCFGLNHTTPNATARMSVIETVNRLAAKFSGVQQGVKSEAASETYATGVFLADCHRAANTAYSFFFATSDSNGTPDVEFNLRGDGTALADGSFTGSGADYQEYFHSADGTALPVGECVVLEGDQVRVATAGDAADRIIGVVRPKEDNKNSAVVGNAAWNHWTDKFLTDDYGRYVLEDYKVYEWDEQVAAVTAMQPRPKMQTRTVVTQQAVVQNGRATLRPVSQEVTEPAYTEHPLFDAQGRAVFVERPVVGADGQVVMTDTLETDSNGQPILTDGVPAVRKQAVLQRVQATHREPVMEMAEVTLEPARTIHHAYAEGKLPEGVTPPANATVTTHQRRKLNPDFREDGGYTPRHERPEWNLIGLLGQVQIRAGAPVNPRWVRMKMISNGVGLWFVR